MQLCYIHIPKTAGTAFREAMNRAVGENSIYWIGHNRPRHEWDVVDAHDLSKYRVVGGHAPYIEFRERLPRSVFATLVREPIRRAVSYYLFLKTHRSEDPNWRRLATIDLLSAITTERRFADEVSNMQCRMLSGLPSFEATVDVIGADGWMIEPSERINRLLRRLAERFKWPFVEAELHNVAPSAYFTELTTQEVEEELRRLNREDALLYEYVTSGFPHRFP